jgi:superfamily II DNA helicase RecQ
VQEPAIKVVAAGKSPIVAVMPTSGGKSLLFIVLVFAEQSSTTIVVVLLIALHSNIKQRCTKLGILCVE